MEMAWPERSGKAGGRKRGREGLEVGASERERRRRAGTRPSSMLKPVVGAGAGTETGLQVDAQK